MTAPDVVVRGVGVMNFPGLGVLVSNARFGFVEGVVAGNMAAVDDEGVPGGCASSSSGDPGAAKNCAGISDPYARAGCVSSSCAGIQFDASAVDGSVGTVLLKNTQWKDGAGGGGQAGPLTEAMVAAFAPTYMHGNFGPAVVTAAPRTMVACAWVGLRADRSVDGNGAKFTGKYPTGGTIGLVSVCDTPTGSAIVFINTAIDGQVGLDGSTIRTYVSGTRGVGIHVDAVRFSLTNTAVGLRPGADGLAPNTACGLMISKIAANASIGSTLRQPGNLTYISGNVYTGIECSAPGLVVSATWIGFAIDGSEAPNRNGKRAYSILSFL